MNKCHSLGHNLIQKITKYKVSTIHLKRYIVLIFIYFATIQVIYVFDTRECWNMIKQLQNQADEIEFWDIEPEDIPGIYFNEFREYVDEEGNVLSPSEVDAIRYKDDYEDDYYR